MSFIRRRENFTCMVCGLAVIGDGYRNHCPTCFTSRHVDVDPGDRQASCGGVMSLAAIDQSHGELKLVHVCRRCGHRKRNKVHPEDSKEQLIAFMRRSLPS